MEASDVRVTCTIQDATVQGMLLRIAIRIQLLDDAIACAYKHYGRSVFAFCYEYSLLFEIYADELDKLGDRVPAVLANDRRGRAIYEEENAMELTGLVERDYARLGRPESGR